MPQVVQQSALNLTALIVPDLYVVVQQPQQLSLNGVPTNVIGVVGSASWGPVNQPTTVGNMAQYSTSFGAVQNRKYDMGTEISKAVQQGASNFVCIRVTDATDTAAIYKVQLTASIFGLQLTSRYTGSLGNFLSFSLQPSPFPNSWRLTIALPNGVAEIYDVPLVGTGYAAFWNALVLAINTGTGALRGPSQLVVASIGTNLIQPTVVALSNTLFTGGTDGASGVALTTLLGQNATVPYTGMYALQNQGVSIGVLADYDGGQSGGVDLGTGWTVIEAFGEQTGIYFMLCTPAGDTIAGAIAGKNTAGLNGYGAKLLYGDWIYWVDQANGGITRLVSPLGFAAGRLAMLSPQNSGLNKPIYAIVGSQNYGVPGSGQVNTYAPAQLQLLFQNGIDLITNPQPGGSYWGLRLGHNSSTNPTVWGTTTPA